MKKFFLWHFRRKDWKEIDSYKSGKMYHFCMAVDGFPDGHYPEIMKVFEHKSGLTVKKKYFGFKLNVLEGHYGIKRRKIR